METIRFISRSAEVGIDATLAIAEMQSEGFVTTAALSDRLGLSVSYLEIILKKLREQDILHSSRGPGGGYLINGDFDHINLWMVASVFEEPLMKKKQAKHTEMLADDFEQVFLQQVVDFLSGKTLADFVGKSQPSTTPRNRLANPFKLKPLPKSKIKPKFPSFVFDLHMAV